MLHAVTGAFGYSGRYIAERLLQAGQQVITLTNSLQRPNPFGGRVKAFPFSFDKPDELAAVLAGVEVVYNKQDWAENLALGDNPGSVRRERQADCLTRRRGSS